MIRENWTENARMHRCFSSVEIYICSRHDQNEINRVFSHEAKERIYECQSLSLFFFPPLSHIVTLKKKLSMSSPLTPFQTTHQHSAMSSSGLHSATGASGANSFSLDDPSPSSTSFSSELYTPLGHSLLSPLGISSPAINTLASIGPIGNENGAYI